MQSFREKVIRYYIKSVSGKMDSLQRQQADLLESLKQETKSTAGDKYETSRAMLHLEQENIASQLSVLLQQKAILESIAVSDAPAQKVQFGSMVKTGKGMIFIAAALGKVLMDDQTVFAVSPESPLGKLLIGKAVQESVSVQSATYKIETIL